MQIHTYTLPVVQFNPGQVVATPGVLDALETTGENAVHFLARHLRGDWGNLDEPDRQANDHALTTGGRLLSAYHLRDGTKIWIITEWDRSSTCLLLPSEY
ncbi:MAG TPA: hypothetical protein VGD69_07575 [Herpetosiphonaceae bacterium]